MNGAAIHFLWPPLSASPKSSRHPDFLNLAVLGKVKIAFQKGAFELDLNSDVLQTKQERNGDLQSGNSLHKCQGSLESDRRLRLWVVRGPSAQPWPSFSNSKVPRKACSTREGDVYLREAADRRGKPEHVRWNL